MTTVNDDSKWIKRALLLAKRGEGFAEPNPMVGCVIVKNGRKIGEGYHQRFGLPHAEPNALASCKTNPKGGTVYVTLEPCCHHGKTPPCSQALIDAKVKRVVVAMADPFSKVAGQGINQLQAHGIEVEVGLLENQARQLNEPYLKRLNTGMPWVIAKWAQTLDGYIATHTGSSKWISNEQSRQMVHQIRSRVDAVMIGIGTALADNATLTARDVRIKRIASRVVIDPSLKLPLTSNLVKTIDQAPLIIATCTRMQNDAKAKALINRGIELVYLKPDKHNKLNLKVLLKKLVKQKQMTNILVEGGAGLHGMMFKQKLTDQVLAFIAPKLLGDPHAINPVNTGQSIRSITQGIALKLIHCQQLDQDIVLDYRTDFNANA